MLMGFKRQLQTGGRHPVGKTIAKRCGKSTRIADNFLGKLLVFHIYVSLPSGKHLKLGFNMISVTEKRIVELMSWH